jgi:hypothetical protein
VTKTELDMAIAFARLELLELDAGKRTLTQCPGVENVAKAIAEAKAPPTRCRQPILGDNSGGCTSASVYYCTLDKGHGGGHRA